MLKQLESLTRLGAIRPLDSQFARFIAMSVAAEDPETLQPLVTLAAALASAELGRGHVCLLLAQLDAQHLFGLNRELSTQLSEGLPAIEEWEALLASSAAVSDGSEATPLVLAQGRLYLHRYWQYEQTVAQRLRQAAQGVTTAMAESAQMATELDTLFARSYAYLFQDLQQLRASASDSSQARQQAVCDKLDVVAPAPLDWAAIDAVLTSAAQVKDLTALDVLIPPSACLNWQKVAAAVALTRQFAVISGGPGTGKTTTVAKLLAALVTQAMQQGDGDPQGRAMLPETKLSEIKLPEIKLVAPTGKAAARLTESIGAAVASLAVDASVKDAIPTQSSTLHRLLGAIPERVAFRHHRDNPLHLDVLVVDEASMVDLPMMARLLDALPPHARLILLGDRDQLASVEAGAVLGDICAFAGQGYSPAHSQLLSQLTGFAFVPGKGEQSVVSDSLCMLQKSYRFHAQSGIGQLAKAINAGQPHLVDQVWQQGYADIQFHPLTTDHYQAMINRTVTFYLNYLDGIRDDMPPREVLQAFSQVRLLCALRDGDFGVSGLNQRIERALAKKGRIKPDDETWYLGRPLMITRNDHGLGLYNGDIGIVMRDPVPDPETGERRLRVFFEMPDGSIRGVLPSRLPEHETVYAMTIHKSQGSEFADTLMVLPAEFSPILTRELIYTGVTRAKKNLYLYAQPEVVSRAVRLRTERASGLAQLLA
ncbi:exodeoxyribonuclease V subunit alpha [Photobacterium sp. TY1-4]|uniref:exodeoxyribonuclease V subunit alpha n=1 Tax=Photobacterium sp. TY1-4 TaxID=2899122 RepID=UPI0021BE4185|nr:exodeoxyribonuclease V subunit alpha [Photobacterium sp. TY1-4]UXI01809.1 exodeoxyribonuclease V subunit alpha [Photobacterium sp. TY1-4]